MIEIGRRMARRQIAGPAGNRGDREDAVGELAARRVGHSPSRRDAGHEHAPRVHAQPALDGGQRSAQEPQPAARVVGLGVLPEAARPPRLRVGDDEMVLVGHGGEVALFLEPAGVLTGPVQAEDERRAHAGAQAVRHVHRHVRRPREHVQAQLAAARSGRARITRSSGAPRGRRRRRRRGAVMRRAAATAAGQPQHRADKARAALGQVAQPTLDAAFALTMPSP
jgi:hypothetical protein